MVDDKELHQTRNVQWFALAAFSNVALASMTSNFANDLSDETKEVKWVVSGVSVALALSTLSFIAHFVLKEKFVGTIMEGGLVSYFGTCAHVCVGWQRLVFCFWSISHQLGIVLSIRPFLPLGSGLQSSQPLCIQNMNSLSLPVLEDF